MKKTIEWLQELPDGYRERAVAQCEPLAEYAEDMADAIVNMCNWSGTEEDVEFWAKVANHYDDGYPLPPLPNKETETPTLEEIKEVLWQCAKTEVSEGGATITRMFDKEASAILELLKSKQR